jgi:universal stress protein E
MDKPRHILVVIDPTAERHPALERGRALALAFGARVELFTCYTRHGIGQMRLDEMGLERLANGLREQGIDTVTEEMSDATIHGGIIRKVLRSRPALVLKDTHPHSLLRRTMLPNTDWQLIRLCPAPLLFVRAGEWHQPPNIAAAVDIAWPGDKPAQLDELLLSAAESFALATRGTLHAVHAYLPEAELAMTPAGTDGAPMRDADVVDYGEARVRRLFADLLATHDMPRVHGHVLTGPPADVLVDFARDNAIDLLVMGALVRGWMYNLMVGSTTERVLDLLPCDVLVMKPADFECPIGAIPGEVARRSGARYEASGTSNPV